jgi:hypothetical protein
MCFLHVPRLLFQSLPQGACAEEEGGEMKEAAHEKFCPAGKILCAHYRKDLITQGGMCAGSKTYYSSVNDWEICPVPSRQQKIGRYPMCEDQPAQIDCRNDMCKWHSETKCTNISPAITIYVRDGFITGNCYSRMID